MKRVFIGAGSLLLLWSMSAAAQEHHACAGPQLGTWKLQSFTTQYLETGQTVDERLHRGGVPQQAERERGRHPDGGVAVGEERQHERRGAQIADPPRPEHGDSAYQ